ncbi:glycoside hydrolase family 5 protein [Mycena alexandri]|uniref:glucan 1,3-beta-glucosidase n=1 Tax=Mycena alexandri TaxID=1745969 RepID=A0AAD6SXX1_9AGAR|nr:glycoside hydrolase family 5 protein [Mycena alexandri]
MMQERDAGDPFLATYAQPAHSEGHGYSDFASPLPGQHPSAFGTDSQLAAAGAGYRDDPRYPPASPNNSDLLLAPGAAAAGAGSYGSGGYNGYPVSSRTSKKRRLIGLGALVALLVIAVAVVVPVYFLVIKKHHSSAAASGASGGASGAGGAANTGGKSGAVVTGGGGSTVLTADGTSFVYNNSFGGYWLADSSNPFLDGAKPNSWTPALNESWNWGTDKIYGVNLGGCWSRVLITPALFQAYPSAPDEWTLAALMRADGSLQKTMEAHYDTFITEQDIAQIAGAGLNWVRVPIPFWAINTWSDVGTDATGATVAEPFLDYGGVEVSVLFLPSGCTIRACCAGLFGSAGRWRAGEIDAGDVLAPTYPCAFQMHGGATYIVRLFGWARKYGLRVNLDLHTAPGSQNGYNHSGKLGEVNFLNGVMGVANAERMLDYIRVIVEFITQPEWANVIPMFGIVNEALLSTIGRPQLTSFYLEAHNMIRGITGVGEGHGPFISIHDGFDGVPNWAGFLPGSDRIILDTHPYFAFDGQKNDAPIATGTDALSAGGIWPKQACTAWGPSINTSRTAFGVTVAGEFSNGYNDCGLYLTGVNGTQSYGGDCSLWLDSSTWNDTVKAGVQQFALASMDATQDWFFWTWKFLAQIGPAADGVVRSPLWSYQLGLEGGWMPTDPRTSVGTCAALGVQAAPFDGTFSAWQTGGAGAGTIDPTAVASFGTWPPITISHVDALATLLPTYTATASIASLTFTTPSPTGSLPAVTPTVSVGSGWFDAQDTASMVTAVAGCTYPDAWSAVSSVVPPVCTGAAAA